MIFNRNRIQIMQNNQDDVIKNCSNGDLMAKLNEMCSLLKILVRQKMSNKSERLMDEVMRKGRLDVNQVGDLFNTSRTWTINLMRKLGKQHGFRFSLGDVNKKIPSVVIYNESLIIKDQHKRIKELLETKGTVTFHDLIQEFGKDISEIRVIVNEYASNRNDCKSLDNKLVRIK